MGLGPAAQLVAVGVDDGRAAAAAARYAAAVALARGWDLMLVHGGGRPEEAVDDGDALLERVLASLALRPATRVHRLVTADAVVDALRRVSGLVSVLALGQDRATLSDPLVLGGVAATVTSAARGPVVLVPRGWDREHGAGRPVAAALEATEPAGPALRCAFVEADLDGVPVVVVRTPAGTTERGEDDDDAAGREGAYAEALTEARREHPGVEARTVLVPGDPATWVPDLGVLASLVVAGPPRAGLPAGAWARSAAGPLLQRSACPLLVAPSDDGPPAPRSGLRRRARARRR